MSSKQHWHRAMQPTRYCAERRAALPFITPQAWRVTADYIIDEDSQDDMEWIATSLHWPHMIIYVKTDYLSKFCQYILPHIIVPFILRTGASDHCIEETNPLVSQILNHPQLEVWNACNRTFETNKLRGLAIGLSDFRYPFGNVSELIQVMKQPREKQQWITSRFTIRKDASESSRRELCHWLKTMYGVDSLQSLSPIHYWEDIACSCFVASPRGNGIDCHRTWEALYLRSIPILLRGEGPTSVYDNLPVVWVDSWTDITPTFLETLWDNEMEERMADYPWPGLFFNDGQL